jgi:hypothetical protein
LTADPTSEIAELSLFYNNANDTEQLSGGIGSLNPASISAGSISTVYFDADYLSTYAPDEYTGELVAADPPSPAPEPSSLWLLLAGIGMLGLVRRRAGQASPDDDA